MTLDPKTPVMPGAISTWERAVKDDTEELARVQARLDYAKRYLADLKAQAARQAAESSRKAGEPCSYAIPTKVHQSTCSQQEKEANLIIFTAEDVAKSIEYMEGHLRRQRQYLLAHPDDCTPPHGLDLEPGSRDSLKVEELEAAFRAHGFDPEKPALVGYANKEKKIQLLSGTHRHEAARRCNMFLPIRMVMRSTVERTWGTDVWKLVIEDRPVKELEMAVIKEGGAINLFNDLEDRVDLERDLER